MLALSFAGIVGTGIAAASFMVQARASMLRPDLGLGRPVQVVQWIDSTGRTLPAIALRGDEPWLAEPGGSIERLAAMWPGSHSVRTPDGDLRASAFDVTPGFIGALGGRIERGRDARAAGEVVLSGRLWRSRWHADPNAVGSAIEIDATTGTIVGVAADGFDGPLCCVPPELWVVHARTESAEPAVVAAVGVPDAGAAAGWLTEAAGDATRGRRPSLVRAESAPYGGEGGIVARMLLVLVGLAVAAWLGTLLSGANLVLADALERADELRMRRALGSHAGDVIARMLLETATLAVLSALVALVGTAVLVRIAPWMLPILGAASAVEVRVGADAFVAAGSSAALTALACALPAGVVALRLGRSPALDHRPRRTRLASMGLTAQIAVASTVIVAVSIFVGRIRSLDGRFVGFRHGETAVHYVSIRSGSPPASTESVLGEVTALAGVADAALTRRLPVYGSRTDSLASPRGGRIAVASEVVTASFFETIGTELVAGAPARTEGEAVVSADVARWLGADPAGAVGTEVVLADTLSLRIVGVVEEATWGSGAVRPTLYRGWGSQPLTTGIVLVRPERRGAVAVGSLMQALGVHALALQPFETMTGLLVRSRVLMVFLTRLAVFFGALCSLVALGGVHAHFVRWVRARKRELGIRSALGAPRARLGSAIARAALPLIAGGVVLGCVLGRAASAGISSLLGDAMIARIPLLMAVAAVAAVASFAALVVPVWRAGAVDPLGLLRAD